MPPTGSTFTDWQQVEQESRLLMNEDFSWSEPPRRRRRRITEEPVRARRRGAVLDYETEHYEPARYDERAYDARSYEPDLAPTREPTGYEPDGYELDGYPPLDQSVAHVGIDEVGDWNQPTATHSHFDELMEQWNAAYGDATERAFDLDDPGVQPAGPGGRRTVVITGRGDDRYMPAPRRPRSAELRFHERSTFSPDRLGFWAVLLCLALAVGAIAH